ncbi:MAG: histidinol-phosphate transaminase [Clostridia bacterium]
MNNYQFKNEGLRLNLNEHPKPPQKISQLSINLDEMSLNRYIRQEDGPLLEELSNYAGLCKEKIVIGNGADEIIANIIDKFCNKSILIVTPTFGVYEHYAKLKGKKVYTISLNNDFSLPYREIINEANQNKIDLVVICNPNNPSGTLFDKDKIIKIIKDTNSYIMIDEAYYEFSAYSIARYIDSFNNLLIIRTLSKAFGLAGLRIGYCMSNERNVENIRSCQMPFNVSNFSQFFGAEVLKNKENFIDYVNIIKRQREELSKKLSELGLKVYQSDTNFLLIKFPNNVEEIYNQLSNRKIHVRKLYQSVPSLINTLRVSIGLKEENEELYRNIKQLIEVND